MTIVVIMLLMMTIMIITMTIIITMIKSKDVYELLCICTTIIEPRAYEVGYDM